MDCLFSIGSPGVSISRWRPHPRPSFKKNQVSSAHTLLCTPAQRRPYTLQGITELPRVWTPSLPSPKRSQELTTPARLWAPPLSPLRGPGGLLREGAASAAAGRSSGPGGAAAVASSGRTEARLCSLRERREPFPHRGPHPRDSAGQSFPSAPNFVAVKPRVGWRPQELRS